MKKIVLIILIILALISLLVTINFVFNPSQKKLTDSEREKALLKILGRKPNLTDSQPKGNTEYKGKLVSFTYPAKAKIYIYKDPNMAKNTSVLETFSFDIDKPHLVFNLSVMKNAASLKDVNDISGVKLRQMNGSGYKQSDGKLGKNKGLVFEKSGSQAEKSGFFLINDKIYEIAVTGNNLEDVSLLFDGIITSFVVF